MKLLTRKCTSWGKLLWDENQCTCSSLPFVANSPIVSMPLSFFPTPFCSKRVWQWTSDLPEWRNMPEQRTLQVSSPLHWCIVREVDLWKGFAKLQSELQRRGSIITTTCTPITPGCSIRIKSAFRILGYAALEASSSDCFKRNVPQERKETKITAAATATASIC